MERHFSNDDHLTGTRPAPPAANISATLLAMLSSAREEVVTR
jgi:hypothetical protein